MSEPITPSPASPPIEVRERSWPLALLLAVAHHLVSYGGIVAAGMANLPSLAGALVLLALCAFPVALVVGVVLLAKGRARTGRVLLFGLLFSMALVALEGLVAFGVCLVAMSGPAWR